MALKDRIVCFQSTASLYWFRLLSCDVLEQTLYEYHPAICWMCPGNSECIAQLPIVFAVQLMVVLNFSAHVQTSHVELCCTHIKMSNVCWLVSITSDWLLCRVCFACFNRQSLDFMSSVLLIIPCHILCRDLVTLEF